MKLLSRTLCFYAFQLFLHLFKDGPLTLPTAQAYDLVEDYKGSTFFDKWDFYGSYDNLTNGDVIWQDRANATSDQLAFVNSAGNAIIKVDNTTNVPYNIKRNSVRITTQQAFGVGSLFIADFVHMPYGCSVWPAFWTRGLSWPEGGEIDIMEGVNLMTQNQMALHTREGCMNVAPAAGAQTGTTGPLDCSQGAGCTVLDNSTSSFGAGFAQAGGGVFAAQFDVNGIFIWFWPRANVPQSLQSTSTSPINSLADWGVPAASYASTGSCNITNFFDAQYLVLDITLCGDWAGVPSIYTPQCASQGSTGLCYNDNVIGPGDRYNNAYFEIQYVRVYSTAAVINPGSSSSGGPSPTSSGSGSSTTTSGSGRTAARNIAPWLLWGILVAVL